MQCWAQALQVLVQGKGLCRAVHRQGSAQVRSTALSCGCSWLAQWQVPRTMQFMAQARHSSGGSVMKPAGRPTASN